MQYGWLCHYTNICYCRTTLGLLHQIILKSRKFYPLMDHYIKFIVGKETYCTKPFNHLVFTSGAKFSISSNICLKKWFHLMIMIRHAWKIDFIWWNKHQIEIILNKIWNLKLNFRVSKSAIFPFIALWTFNKVGVLERWRFLH